MESQHTQVDKHASHVIKQLRQRGCDFISAVRTPRGVIIKIKNPTPELARNALEIREKHKGQPSIVYTKHLDGCLVSWRQGEIQ